MSYRLWALGPQPCYRPAKSRPAMRRVYSLAHGHEEEHAARLVAGLARLPTDYVARLCYLCRGHGCYMQRYGVGCGGGYYRSIGACEICDGTGLLQHDVPAPMSVVNQVLQAGGDG